MKSAFRAHERTARQQERERHEAEVVELRTVLSTARENAATATDSLDHAVIAHTKELERRDEAAAKAAAAHEQEMVGLLGEVNQANTSVATTAQGC